MNKDKVTNSDLFKTLSDKDKVYFILYDYPNSTRDTLLKRLLGVSSVSSMSSVSTDYEGTNNTNRTHKTHNTNRTNSISTIDMSISRGKKKEEIKVNKSKIPYTYTLTHIGIVIVEDRYIQYKKEISLLLDKQKNESKEITSIKSFVKYFSSKKIIPNVLKSIRENQCISLDFLDFCKFEPEVSEFLLNNPEDIIKAAEIAINQNEDVDSKVVLCNTPNSIIKNITHLRVTDIDKLVCLVCEIKSRSTSAIITTSIKFECPNCGNVLRVIQMDNMGKLVEPTKCGCGRNGKFRELHREREDYLRLTVSDLYSSLTSAEVPEEINVIIRRDDFQFEKLAEGDRIKIIGIVNVCDILTKTGLRQTIQQKIIRVVGLEKVEKDYDKVFLSEEDEKIFENIKKDPIKWHRELLFSDLKDIELAEKINILQLYGNFHVLQVGIPGIGKSESSKRISKIAVRGSFCNCINASPSGLLGATTKNQFTGKFTLDGGVFKRMHPNGIVVCDEINRGSEDFLQPALLGIMNDKRLNVKKANVDVDIPCDISISATANPLKKCDGFNTMPDVFGIIEPLWDRFDFKIYYNNEMDYTNITQLQNVIEENKKDFSLENADLEIIKKYQIKAQMIDVKFTKEDFKRMAIVLNQFNKDGHEKSYRPIRTIKSLLYSICKLHHRESPIQSDYQFATDIVVELNMAREEYIESQKENQE